MLTVDLDDVADELEREETDTDGQQDVERGPTDLEPNCLQYAGKRLGKEIEVFEIDEQGDAQHDTQRRNVRGTAGVLEVHLTTQPCTEQPEY